MECNILEDFINNIPLANSTVVEEPQEINKELLMYDDEYFIALKYANQAKIFNEKYTNNLSLFPVEKGDKKKCIVKIKTQTNEEILARATIIGMYRESVDDIANTNGTCYIWNYILDDKIMQDIYDKLPIKIKNKLLKCDNKKFIILILSYIFDSDMFDFIICKKCLGNYLCIGLNVDQLP